MLLVFCLLFLFDIFRPTKNWISRASLDFTCYDS